MARAEFSRQAIDGSYAVDLMWLCVVTVVHIFLLWNGTGALIIWQ